MMNRILLLGGAALGAALLGGCADQVVGTPEPPTAPVGYEGPPPGPDAPPPPDAYVAQPPPPDLVETAPPPPPGPRWFWVRGHYNWNGFRYVWIPGHWSHRHYRPGYWRHDPRGYIYVGGRF